MAFDRINKIMPKLVDKVKSIMFMINVDFISQPFSVTHLGLY